MAAAVGAARERDADQPGHGHQPPAGPAAFAIIASAKLDERGITAYCLDLPGTLRQHAGARGAHVEEIAAHLKDALAFLRRRYGEPVSSTTADRFTAYYWWSLPGGVRLHLVHTDKVVADLWVTRLDAADVPAGADEPDLRGKHFLALAGVLPLAVIVRIFW